ncbi:MAG: LCP family protein [Lachnospiraceae bacterium]|nr:LCP family protein [Lachnospiraceae bacterium]
MATGRNSGNRRNKDYYNEDEYEERGRERSSRHGNGSRNGATSDARRKQAAAKKKDAKKRKKIIFFIIEIIVLLIMLGVLWLVTRGERVGKVNINEEDIVINDQVAANEEMNGYRNIALFGVDSTTGALTKNTRSDTIMIASVNQDTGDIKLVSVYRDSYMNLGNDSYNKCNAAYAKGGPEQAMNMLNMNMDLDITDFVTVGFEGLSNVIDALGGVEIDVDDAEISHLNNYQYTMAEDLKRSYTEVTKTGKQTLNGLQATAYCRIRYTAGDDFMRAFRQREVLQAVMSKAKNADAATLTKIANEVFDDNVVYTSLDLSEILGLLKDITKYSVAGDEGFPQESMRATGTVGAKGSCVIPISLESNVEWLHQFLFDDQSYEASSDVKSYSQKVESDTASYVK